jgi:hypothetical protein
MKFYDGDKPGQTPGLVAAAGAFQWWEAGAMFGQVSEQPIRQRMPMLI